MAGTTSFQQWNNAGVNQETDAQYAVDSLRTGGAPVGGILPSHTFNKFAYQMSTGWAAFCQMLANKGFSTSDADVDVLSAVFANLITSADIKSQITNLPFSPTPVLDGSKTNAFLIFLNGNVTLPTISGLTDGQIITMLYFQDGVGGRTVTFPAQMFEAVGPDPRASSLSAQMFIVTNAGAQFLRAVGPLMSDDGSSFTKGHSNVGGSLIADGLGTFGIGITTPGSVTAGGTATAASLVVNGASTLNGPLTAFGATSIGALLQCVSFFTPGNANLGSLQIAGGAPNGQIPIGDGTHFIPSAIPKPQKTLNDVTGVRAFGTTFTNNFGAPITVSVTMGRSATGGGDYRLDGFVGGLEVASNTSSSTVAGMTIGVTFEVPNGSTYSATATNLQGAASVFLQRWIEWTYI